MVSHLFKKVLEWVKVVQTNNVASKTYQDVEIVNYDRALEFLRNTYQWSRNEVHVGGAIFIFLVVYNFSANQACRRCFLLPSTKIAIQV